MDERARQRADDEAFVAWAERRNTWLFRAAFGTGVHRRGRVKSKAARGVLLRAIACKVWVDRRLWVLTH